MKQTKAQLQAEIREFTRDLAHITTKLSEAESKLSYTEAKLKQANDTTEYYSKRSDDFKDRFDKINQQLAKAELDTRSAQSNNDHLTLDNAQHVLARNELERIISGLEAGLASICEERANAKRENVSLNTQNYLKDGPARK